MQNYILEYFNEAENQDNVESYHYYSVIAESQDEAEALIRKDDKENHHLILVEDTVSLKLHATIDTNKTTKGNVIMAEFEANEVNNGRVDDWAKAENSI